jgi:hypothetical protein
LDVTDAETMSTRTTLLPIGYWLKRADALLTQRIDDAQRAHGLTRLGWQALNLVSEKRTATHIDIVTTLRPFADAAAVDQILAGVADRHVLSGSAETGFDLNPAGAEIHDRARTAQLAIRQNAVAGISNAEYATTVRVLQRLVENLLGHDLAPKAT